MKKMFIIVFILIVTFFTLGNSKTDFIPSEFIKEIEKYESYNKNNLTLYYNEYKKNNNIILSLNSINHPNFFNINYSKKSFKFGNQYFVNKAYFLNEHYIPNTLVPVKVKKINRKNEIMLIDKTTQIMYNKFLTECIPNNSNLMIFSAYRSYITQNNNYTNSINKSYVALPGHSEHQTGCAIDISTTYYGLTIDFEDSIEFEILSSNIYKYGFILRYPKDKDLITGYPYEPWHFRYVGIDIATKIFNEKITLEEYVYKYIEIK